MGVPREVHTYLSLLFFPTAIASCYISIVTSKTKDKDSQIDCDSERRIRSEKTQLHETEHGVSAAGVNPDSSCGIKGPIVATPPFGSRRVSREPSAQPVQGRCGGGLLSNNLVHSPRDDIIVSIRYSTNHKRYPSQSKQNMPARTHDAPHSNEFRSSCYAPVRNHRNHAEASSPQNIGKRLAVVIGARRRRAQDLSGTGTWRCGMTVGRGHARTRSTCDTWPRGYCHCCAGGG